MRIAVLSVLTLAAAGFAQEEPPAGLSVHTWVREDIFAGFMVNDLERFAKGVKKLDRWLDRNPDDPRALAWLGGAELYLAVVAYEAGKTEEFARRYRKGHQAQERALALTPKDQGVLATYGGTRVLFADRLPPEQRAESWKIAQALYGALATEQAAIVEKLPLHMRGELLAGLAMSAQRVGDQEQARKYLAEIVSVLPGTPYEARAKRWLENPELAGRSSIVCQTCHETGRLENRLKQITR